MEGRPNNNQQNCQTYGEDAFWEPSDTPATLTPVPYINRFGGMRHGFNQPSTNSQFSWTLSALEFPGGQTDEGYASQKPISTPNDALQESSMNHNDYTLFPPDENTTETEDWPMTTPAPSRKRSEFVNETYAVELHNRQPLELCTYPDFDGAFPSSSLNRYGCYSPQTNGTRTFASLPINHLLNCAPPAPSTDPDHTPKSPVFSPGSSYSSLASTPSTTTLPTSSIFEQTYFLINTLYHTCLDASTLYIRHRSSSRHYPKTRTGRYYPYRSPPPPRERAPASLMDNISTICTHLWRKARKDVMAPHRAEAETVRVMGNLYAWGEVLAKGVERDTDEDGNGGDDAEGVMGMRVADAARLFCEWLGDGRAAADCEELATELRALLERNREAGENDDEDFEAFEDVM